METHYFNKEVTVDAVAFRGQKKMFIYPKHMWIDSEDVTLEDDGLSYSVQQAGKEMRLFDVSDGRTRYRLRLDPAQYIWTLIRRSPVHAGVQS